ncbi:8777_t:CDS:10 [Paraglomus occultum]|uniref:8777_t:CDS:1 n=1 Tax=Paraglomus occultum TaxID=144539 RepID=A0A9N9AF62_9GLOM|nr:8777_t:CDS:10 [Paraglomus occultum]
MSAQYEDYEMRRPRGPRSYTPYQPHSPESPTSLDNSIYDEFTSLTSHLSSQPRLPPHLSPSHSLSHHLQHHASQRSHSHTPLTHSVSHEHLRHSHYNGHGHQSMYLPQHSIPPYQNYQQLAAQTKSPPQIEIHSQRIQASATRSMSTAGRIQPTHSNVPPISTNFNRSNTINGSGLIIPARSDNIPRREKRSVSASHVEHQRHRSITYSDASSETSSATASPKTPYPKSRIPIVYPALLSRVAEAFRHRIITSTKSKDGIEYKDCFDGKEAVEAIAYIIKTTDRNLALLLGRALDAQKFFHDVTYDHRLRDSPNELYQFHRLTSIMSSGNFNEAPNEVQAQEDGNDLPNGVFTLLTDCYSPTCTRDNVCYSITCPRRLEQAYVRQQKPNAQIKKVLSRESLSEKKDQKLWIHSVPTEIANSVSESEKKRQEAINEVIYTEKDFVKDLEYIRDCWMTPLSNLQIIPEHRRAQFLHNVFYNILEIHSVNARLSDALQKRQNSYAIVEQIGDIFLEYVPLFDPFIKYGSHQIWGKYDFEKEKSTNSAFAKFVDETERLAESRKLELNGYLTKPTTRLGRYPLLLEAVLKHTPENDPDKVNLPKVISIIKEFLTNVNIESGKTEDRFNLQQLHDQLVIPKGSEFMDLRLTDEGRQIIYKGSLKKRGGNAGESDDLQVFLLDHALLMVKARNVKQIEQQYKIHRKPIPLQLLSISTQEGVPEKSGRQRSNTSSDKSFPITFTYIGKKGFTVTLYATTQIGREKWIQQIKNQKQALCEHPVFQKNILIQGKIFSGTNRISCAAYFDSYQKLALGTDTGIWIGDISPDAESVPQKSLEIEKVSQIEMLENYGFLLVLADKSLYSFPIDALQSDDGHYSNKRAHKLGVHASFIKSGTCMGKTLVATVKSTALQSTIKTLEPIDYNSKNKNKGSAFKFLRNSHDYLKIHKELYVPAEVSSLHFLKRKLCVGCAKGFEIVDLESLNTQRLLDSGDPTLNFIQKKDSVRPIALFRLGDSDFVLCYDEFAFYVNKDGRRSRHNWLVTWEGAPTSFAIQYPYILAFESSFIEVRNVENGSLEQIIEGCNLQCLFSDYNGNILVSSNDPMVGGSEVFSLKIVEERQKSTLYE